MSVPHGCGDEPAAVPTKQEFIALCSLVEWIELLYANR